MHGGGFRKKGGNEGFRRKRWLTRTHGKGDIILGVLMLRGTLNLTPLIILFLGMKKEGPENKGGNVTGELKEGARNRGWGG